MKLKFLIPFVAALMLTGCSGTGNSSQEDPAQMEDTEALSLRTPGGSICYLTDHGTVDPEQLTSFSSALQEYGCTWTETSIRNLPIDADAVIFNSPSEDLTKEDLDIIDEYMAEGGHMIVLMPANDDSSRFKYIERFLREYSILMDYDLITETDEANMSGDYVKMSAVSFPEGMSLLDASMEEGTVWMNNPRSFHMAFSENYGSIHMDAMIKSTGTSNAAPYGGDYDDPTVYENCELITMMYARNEDLSNAAVVAVGSSDFLLDQNYSEETSDTMHFWIYSVLGWMTSYLR